MKKSNKVLSIVICLVLLVSVMPSMALASASISVGDYVQMGTYNDAPILWRCIAIDSNGPLMLADEILCMKSFDASGDNLTGSHARGYNNYRSIAGSNYWGDSNIRNWLNSDELAGKVVWDCKNPPIDDEVTTWSNGYADEAGFLTNFSIEEKKIIKSVTQKNIIDAKEYSNMSAYGSEAFIYNMDINSVVTNYANAYSESFTDKMFLLDVVQLDALVKNLGTDYAKGIVSVGSFAYTDAWKVNSLTEGGAHSWWLRTPVTEATGYGNYLRCVYKTGTEVGLDYAKQSFHGIRPAFYLNDSDAIYVSGTGAKSLPYTLKATPTAISEYGATVAKYNDNIINVSGNAGTENTGKTATIVLAPKATYNTLLTAKHITNATVADDGSYMAKFKAVIAEDDVLMVKVGGKNIAYTLTAPKDAEESIVELAISLDENNKVNVNVVNKYIDATTAKLIVATYDENGTIIKTKIIDYSLAFGPNGEVQKYVTENAVEGVEVRVFLWNNFTDMIPLAGEDSEPIGTITVLE